jgi:hypothetical protein
VKMVGDNAEGKAWLRKMADDRAAGAPLPDLG